MQKTIKNLFFFFVSLSLLAPLWVFKDLLFPFVTSKAFFFRIAIELAFPLYVYLLVSEKKLRPSLKNPLNFLVLAFLAINILSSFFGVSVIRSLWGNFERMGGAYYLAHLAALYFYILMLGKMGESNQRKGIDYLFYAIFGFLVAIVLGWSSGSSFVEVLGLIFGLVTYFLLICWFKGSYLERFLKALLTAALIVTGNGIYGWLGFTTLVPDPSLPGRVSSTLGNPIYVGSFLIIPLFLTLFFATGVESWIKKSAYYFLSFLFALGIFLSGTRGALVGLILGSFLCALVYLFLCGSKKIKLYGFVALGIFIILAGLLFKFNNKLPQGSTLQRIFKLKDSNTSARLIQWKIALTGYKDRPLLGTGTENYYIIANQYYNPEIAQYDKSWFDKPHNYLLEILVTNGSVGFLVYLALLVFLVLALYRGFRAGFFGLMEFCLLLAALVVYQIQNLFVFDTVPASLVFYAFTGFAGYISGVSGPEVKGAQVADKPVAQALPLAALGVALAVSAYAIYATEAVPMAVAKNVNYGFAYAEVDADKALSYFEKAVTLPFNFDKTETASKFSEFATTFVRSTPGVDREKAVKIFQASTGALLDALDTQPDNPILWQRLASNYIYMALLLPEQKDFGSKAEQAINKAIILAPKRQEGYFTLAQIRAMQSNLDEAQTIIRAVMEDYPKDALVKAQLASYLRFGGKTDEAVGFAEQALELGYKIPSYAEAKWLVDYYAQKKEFDKAIALQIEAAKVEANNVQLFIDLAHLYAKAGQGETAKNLAENIIKVDASKQKEMQTFINSLPKSASSTPVKK